MEFMKTSLRNLQPLAVVLLGLLGILLLIPLFQILFLQAEYLWHVYSVAFLIILPIAYWIMFVWARLRGGEMCLNMLVAIVAVASSLYATELFLIAAGPHITLPASYDRRSKGEVVRDMRGEGFYVVPSVHPKNIMPGSLSLKRTEILPLGGIARATTVFCNEVGKYYVYESDEYGFTNPHGIFSEPIDIALVGDSFTQGFCAPDGESYAEMIRLRYPRLVNLGNNGNGPLLKLASLREYLSHSQPAYVFWFYFEGNDIEDLSRELAHPILSRYLADPNFNQRLKENQLETNEVLKDFVENQLLEEEKPLDGERIRAELIKNISLWLKLWHIRALLGLTDLRREWILRHWNNEVDEAEVASSFEGIMREAKSRVEGWGGSFVVVYLPSYRTFGYRITHPWRQRVLDVLHRESISTIDLIPIFEQHGDPPALYNYRKEAHYNPAGNKLVAEAVLNYVRADSAGDSKM